MRPMPIPVAEGSSMPVLEHEHSCLSQEPVDEAGENVPGPTKITAQVVHEEPRPIPVAEGSSMPVLEHEHSCISQEPVDEAGEDVPGPTKITAQVVHEEPRVTYFTDFVSKEEVQHLLQLCEGRWERSATTKGTVSDLLGNRNDNKSSHYGEESIGETRTSTSVYLHWTESIVVERIAARVATVTGHKLENVEPLVLLRYEPGQFFKMHHDGAFRPATVFVYLNDVEKDAGGDTFFPHLGFKVQPAACTAVMWNNRLANGEADTQMMHEAMPITSGVKYAINCFVSIHSQRDTDHIVINHNVAGSDGT